MEVFAVYSLRLLTWKISFFLFFVIKNSWRLHVKTYSNLFRLHFSLSSCLVKYCKYYPSFLRSWSKKECLGKWPPCKSLKSLFYDFSLQTLKRSKKKLKIKSTVHKNALYLGQNPWNLHVTNWHTQSIYITMCTIRRSIYSTCMLTNLVRSESAKKSRFDRSAEQVNTSYGTAMYPARCT